MVASHMELKQEKAFSMERRDHFRAACIQELISEV